MSLIAKLRLRGFHYSEYMNFWGAGLVCLCDQEVLRRTGAHTLEFADRVRGAAPHQVCLAFLKSCAHTQKHKKQKQTETLPSLWNPVFSRHGSSHLQPPALTRKRGWITHEFKSSLVSIGIVNAVNYNYTPMRTNTLQSYKANFSFWSIYVLESSESEHWHLAAFNSL